ncbi:MAG: glycosyltransferase family 39 protein [Kiritimatiellia bacterium]
MAGSTRLFGEAEWALRLPSFLFGLAVMPLTFLFFRRLAGAPAALLAMACVAAAPGTVEFGFLARGYSIQTALFLGLLLSLHRLALQGGAWSSDRRRVPAGADDVHPASLGLCDYRGRRLGAVPGRPRPGCCAARDRPVGTRLHAHHGAVPSSPISGIEAITDQHQPVAAASWSSGAFLSWSRPGTAGSGHAGLAVRASPDAVSMRGMAPPHALALVGGAGGDSPRIAAPARRPLPAHLVVSAAGVFRHGGGGTRRPPPESGAGRGLLLALALVTRRRQLIANTGSKAIDISPESSGWPDDRPVARELARRGVSLSDRVVSNSVCTRLHYCFRRLGLPHDAIDLPPDARTHRVFFVRTPVGVEWRISDPLGDFPRELGPETFIADFPHGTRLTVAERRTAPSP